MGCGSWKDDCSSGLDTGSGEGELGSELLSPKEVELTVQVPHHSSRTHSDRQVHFYLLGVFVLCGLCGVQCAHALP